MGIALLFWATFLMGIYVAVVISIKVIRLMISSFSLHLFFKTLDRNTSKQINYRKCYIEISKRCWKAYKKEYIRETEIEYDEFELRDILLSREVEYFEQVYVNDFFRAVELKQSYEWISDTHFHDERQRIVFYVFINKTQTIFNTICSLYESEQTLVLITDQQIRTKIEWKMCGEITKLIQEGTYHGVIEKLRQA